MLNHKKIAFIGAGNMASAIIKGILKSKVLSPGSIYVSDNDKSKLNIFKELGINVNYDNTYVVEQCDIIIFAIKPNIYNIVLSEISSVNNISNKVFVSIAAGITIQYIKSFFKENIKIVRVMPNTPALVGEGMTVTSYKAPTTEDELEIVNYIFKTIGKVETIEEKYMDQVVAINGSSPAYVYMMIEAMADAAVMEGIPRALSYKLAAQSVLGAAKMVLETGQHPAELKDMVCSPGGTTIEAVYYLEKKGFRASLMGAMEKCTKKAIQLRKKYM